MTVLVDATPETISVVAPSRLADKVSTIPGLRAKPGTNTWEGPTTAAAMVSVARTLGKLDEFEATPRATKLMRKIRQLKEQVQHLKDGTFQPQFAVPEGLSLWDYQPAAIWMMVERKRAIIGDDMGTGKTVMALTAARQVCARTTLIVCPSNVKHKWGRFAAEWYPEATVFVLDGTKAKKEKKLAEAEDILVHTDDQPVVVVVNWESLSSLSKLAGFGSIKLTEKQATPGALNQIYWECVIADEAHRAKDPKSQQTRALKACAKGAVYRWALTGTPVLNTPSDLWSIGNFYDPDTYGTSMHRWHQRYVDFLDTHFGPKDVGLRSDNEDEFTTWFDLGFIRRTKAEVHPDLPPITYDVRELEMTSKQQAAYNKMVTDMMAVIDDEFLLANNPLTLLTRLSQIASATPVVSDMEVTALDAPSNKVQAVVEILASMSEEQQLVVFAQSEKLISLTESVLLKQKNPPTVVRITGKESAKVKDMNVETFQAGRARVALVTTQAGGEGIDLFAADTCVFMQRGYAYGQNTQAESRLHRPGQESDKVVIIDLVSIGTVDEDVRDALQSKEEMAEQVLRDKARLMLQRKVGK